MIAPQTPSCERLISPHNSVNASYCSSPRAHQILNTRWNSNTVLTWSFIRHTCALYRVGMFTCSGQTSPRSPRPVEGLRWCFPQVCGVGARLGFLKRVRGPSGDRPRSRCWSGSAKLAVRGLFLIPSAEGYNTASMLNLQQIFPGNKSSQTWGLCGLLLTTHWQMWLKGRETPCEALTTPSGGWGVLQDQKKINTQSNGHLKITVRLT